MRSKLIALLFFVSNCIWAQDLDWKPYKIDDLTIFIPGEVARIDTTTGYGKDKVSITIIKSEGPSYIFGVNVSDASNTVNKSREDWHKSIKEVANTFCKSRTKKENLICSISDTIIASLPATKANSIGKSNQDAGIQDLVFIVNKKTYVISVSIATEDKEEERTLINKFFSSIHFRPAKEKNLKSAAELIGYNIGEFLGMTLVIGIITAIIFFIVRANKKRRQKFYENKYANRITGDHSE